MKVYFDLCAIQRPLDTYSHTRIVLDAEAVLGLLARCDAGEIEIVSSEALEYETAQNPLPVRREHALAVLAKASAFVSVSDVIEARARRFVTLGMHPLDALHVALAEAGEADYFCTCDDRLLARARQLPDLSVRVITPIDLVQEIEK